MGQTDAELQALGPPTRHFCLTCCSRILLRPAHLMDPVPASSNSTVPHCAVLQTAAGVPVLADRAFLDAYSLLSADTVFQQHPGEDELDAMFRVARLPEDAIWRTRTALQQLREDMNGRCVRLLLGWLQDKGLQPDSDSGVVLEGL